MFPIISNVSFKSFWKDYQKIGQIGHSYGSKLDLFVMEMDQSFKLEKYQSSRQHLIEGSRHVSRYTLGE